MAPLRDTVRDEAGTRCSRPHAATKIAAIASLAWLAFAAIDAVDGRTAEAYVVKRTTRGELVHWDEREVDYTFDPSIAANVPNAEHATRTAMQSWSTTEAAPELRGHDAADVRDAPTQPGLDEKNGIFFMPHGYAPAGRALAITVLTYDNASGRILDADVIVNGSYAFAVLPETRGALPDSASSNSAAVTHTSAHNTDSVTHDVAPQVATPDATPVYDLHHVVAHELGHTLGMNDELGRDDALMYRYSSPNDPGLRAPAPDDVAGLSELYATKIEASGQGCTHAAIAPKKPSHATSSVAMGVLFLGLVFLALRGGHDRRVRAAFVLFAGVSLVAMVPALSRQLGHRDGHAFAAGALPGHARATVTASQTQVESGLFSTSYELTTTACRTLSCPSRGRGVAWGGQMGNVRQDVGEAFAPTQGDVVDVSFEKLPSALAPLSQPLGGKVASSRPELVRVVTRALQ